MCVFLSWDLSLYVLRKIRSKRWGSGAVGVEEGEFQTLLQKENVNFMEVCSRRSDGKQWPVSHEWTPHNVHIFRFSTCFRPGFSGCRCKLRRSGPSQPTSLVLYPHCLTSTSPACARHCSVSYCSQTVAQEHVRGFPPEVKVRRCDRASASAPRGLMKIYTVVCCSCFRRYCTTR